MTPAQSERLLRESLQDVAPTLAAVWPVFKEAARRPVEVVDDALLFEGGVWTSPGRPDHYYLHLCRQFIHAEEAEDEDFEQLSVHLLYRDLTLPVIKPSWSYGFDNSFEAFFRHVEVLPQFLVVSAMAAYAVDIDRQRI